ncbi:MAG TPA: hypothetical protein VE823_06050, partial [Geodermatophilus sp.]|nr:hypothetical protein [Geodermatophilus sp.]
MLPAALAGAPGAPQITSVLRYLRVHADLLHRGPVTVDGRVSVGWVFLGPDGSPWRDRKPG